MGPQRLEILPNVPSVAELGLPQVEAIAWNGIFVPAGTPAAVVQTLHRELVRAYKAPEVREQLRAGGSFPAPDTPGEFCAFVRAGAAKWSRLVRGGGLNAPITPAYKARRNSLW